jgi:hypothetical protein
MGGDRCRVDDVGGERLPCCDRARCAARRRSVCRRREAEHAQMRSDRRAEVAGELFVIGAAEILDGDDAELGETSRGSGPDAPDVR